MATWRTLETHNEEVKKLSKNKFECIEYNPNPKKLGTIKNVYKHIKENHKFETTLARFVLEPLRCYICEPSIKFKHNLKTFKAFIEEISEGRFTCIKMAADPLNRHTLHIFKHIYKGCVFEKRFESFRAWPHLCSVCGETKERKEYKFKTPLDEQNRPSLNRDRDKLKIKCQAKLDAKFGNSVYTIIGEYNGSNKSNIIKHQCGLEFNNVPKGMINFPDRIYCECKKLNPLEANPDKLKKKYQLKLDEAWGKSEFKIISKNWRGSEARHKFKHSCGLIFKSLPQTVLNGYKKCRCQHIVRQITLEDHNVEVLEHRGKDWICEKYRGSHKDSVYRHLPCNKKLLARKDNFLKGSICKHCHGPNGSWFNKPTYEGMVSLLNKAYRDDYTLITKKNIYKAKDRVRLNHQVCGNTFVSTVERLTKQEKVCPICFIQLNNLGQRIVEIGVRGKVFRCQGFEPFSLKLLMQTYKAKDIINGRDKRRLIIILKFKKTTRRYYPDFFIPHENIVVETKSIVTLGLIKKHKLFGKKNIFELNQAKARACIKQGYKFILHVFNNKGELLDIPDNWMHRSKNDLKNYLSLS